MGAVSRAWKLGSLEARRVVWAYTEHESNNPPHSGAFFLIPPPLFSYEWLVDGGNDREGLWEGLWVAGDWDMGEGIKKWGGEGG